MWIISLSKNYLFFECLESTGVVNNCLFTACLTVQSKKTDCETKEND